MKFLSFVMNVIALVCSLALLVVVARVAADRLACLFSDGCSGVLAGELVGYLVLLAVVLGCVALSLRAVVSWQGRRGASRGR